jgi:hypothetical protein
MFPPGAFGLLWDGRNNDGGKRGRDDDELKSSTLSHPDSTVAHDVGRIKASGVQES